MSFCCPICHADQYQGVVVQRPSGEVYPTEFFQCLGCSVMFTEPEIFTAAPACRVENDQAAAVPLELGHDGIQPERRRHEEMRYRFWSARARREGSQPTPSAIQRLRARYRQ